MAIGILKAGVNANDATASTGQDVADTVNSLLGFEINELAFQPSVIQPTVTVSAGGAATTITGSVRIQPMKFASDATKFQVVNDPNFRISGIPQGKLIIDAADCARPDFLTNGSATASRWNPTYEFTHTGQQLEIYVRALASTIKYRIWVNGRPVTTAMQTISTAAGQRHRILVDFGSVGTRDLRFEMWEHEFAGVFVETFGSITAAQVARKKLAIMSDSTGAGANGPIRMEVWPWYACGYLNFDYINLSIGGSGYVSSPSFQTRLQDVIDANPDYLIVAGGQNDKAGSTTDEIMSAFKLFCDSVASALPNCKIIVGGAHMTTQNADATGASLEVALSAECAVRGYPFLSQRNPTGLLSAMPAWANGVAYKFGDQIKQSELPFVCTVEHTSSGSFDATKFRCSAVFSGTGKVGTTAGNGNFDICMTSDGVHHSAAGHALLGMAYAQQVCNKVNREA